MKRKISWDSYFMTMVYLVASKSKDETTHIGAVIVGVDNEVISTGYNGFVRGVNDYDEKKNQRPEKYFWIEHAEKNAIFNTVRRGSSSLKGCKIYTNAIPCMGCAKAIVQSGICEVIVDKNWLGKKDDWWSEDVERSLELFKESKVKLRYFDEKFVEIYKFKRSEKIPLEF